jgi:hypothetical protein
VDVRFRWVTASVPADRTTPAPMGAGPAAGLIRYTRPDLCPTLAHGGVGPCPRNTTTGRPPARASWP